jgi:ABC-type polar amino acid transport system ATPase subunit
MNPEDEVILEARGVRKRWPDGRLVLDGVDLAVQCADVVVILGPNGCGKSTLLRCLNQLEPYQEGEVRLRGEVASRGVPLGHAPTRAEQAATARLRRRVGMVFQQFNLFPHLNVLENVMIGPLRALRRDRAAAEAVAMECLGRVGLADRANARALELSGGQQQRVAIARSLAMAPELMLFDEPTSALDPVLTREVFKVIRDLVFRDGMTMLVVTHDLDFAREVADRIIFMDRGRVALHGPPDEVLAAGHELVRAFVRR